MSSTLRPDAALNVRRIAGIAALATLLLHLVANPHYGFYRDELYFIVCGWRPDWGYVDQPPLVPLLCALTQIFGHSLFAIRALPALFAAGGVYVTCLLAGELGGSAFAVAVAGLLTAFAPILAGFGVKASTDMPGLLLWPLLALILARLLAGGDRRLWLLFGVVAGIAAEAKYSIALYAGALLLAVVFSGDARVLRSRWMLAGAAIGIAIALPSLLWQAAHGFPMMELLRDQQAGKVIRYPFPEFVLQQILITNPFLAPFWIAGVVWSFTQRRLRWIGWTCVLFLAAIAASHGKIYYTGDVYPLAFAAGAIALERLVRATAWRSAIVGAASLAALLPTPFVYPVLGESQLAGFTASAGRSGEPPLASERNLYSPITETFADMHGWPELARAVAGVYDALPPSERVRAAILTSNAFEAAAIDFYGSQYGLPPAISGHNAYYFWGPRGYDGSVVIEVNGACGGPLLFAERHVEVAHANSRWALPAENDFPISVCKRLRGSLAAHWGELRRFW